MKYNNVSKQQRRKWDRQLAFINENGPSELNDWEVGFIQSLSEQREKEDDLSLKQSFKLKQIFKALEEALG